MSIFPRYEEAVDSGALSPDPAQLYAALALQHLYDGVTGARTEEQAGWKKAVAFFTRKKTDSKTQGLYLYGGVGRGKSMLMDMFFHALPEQIRKRRVHFHAFMIETHDWLHARRTHATGRADGDKILPDYARHVASSAKVLCFDEFHVTDVADAMILSRLFTALLDQGVIVVATSNWPPERLYEGGLQRERFLPFIDLINARLDVVHLDSETDYREEVLQDLDTYLYPLNAKTEQYADDFFKVLSKGEVPEEKTITVKGRDIQVRAAGNVARFSFAQLCEQPLGAEDYLAIAGRFEAVMIERLPKMGYDRRNEVKRFMTLIDVLYDTRRRIVITAEAAPEKIYYGHDYAFEFDRTISRLKEMQSSSYMAAAKKEQA